MLGASTRIAVLGLFMALSACGSREPCTGGTDPGGMSCEGGASQCSRNCVCENGEEISAGRCENEVCVGVATTCTQQCAEFDFGGFTGDFCAEREIL